MIHLLFTPHEDQHVAVAASGPTLFQALASLERAVNLLHGPDIHFSELPCFPQEFGDFVEAMSAIGGTHDYHDFSEPELRYTITRTRPGQHDESFAPTPDLLSVVTGLASLLPYEGETELPHEKDGEQLTTERDGEDAMSTLSFHIMQARMALAHRSAPPAAVVPALPEEFTLHAGESNLADVDMTVPPSLLDFASSHYGRPCSIVIGQLYNGEDLILCIDEQLPDERDKLLSEGWPARFIDYLEQLVKDGHSYVRIFA
ncbi:MAG: hypothetical protein EOP85_02875 [Verrucomicrobiaceae bacterium]|nr:MAG: hypothetical protein EOP85_02875 [Verrucomicrobiaceae bacterium]